MFAIKSLSKYIFGGAGEVNTVEIPQGQLYIVRPHSPKGYSELIFKDAAAYIRRTGQEYQYQLVIQRAYEEGEAELNDEEAEERALQGPLGDKDEKIFILDEELRLRIDLRDDGETVVAWRDLSGDLGDLFEFVCESTVRPEVTANFELVAAQCQFETKYRRHHQQATDEDLRQFAFEEDPEIPQASPLSSPKALTAGTLFDPSPTSFQASTSSHSSPDMVRSAGTKPAPPTKAIEQAPTKAPLARKKPTGTKTLTDEQAELHLFDFNSAVFIPQDSVVRAQVTEIGNYNYWLQISGSGQEWLGEHVTSALNPVFNFEQKSFIFNHIEDDGSAYSWLLRFQTVDPLERFKDALTIALWQHANQVEYGKTIKTDADRDYVLDAFNDLVLEDNTRDDQREAEAREEDEEEFYSDDEEVEQTKAGKADYDTDEDEDEEEELADDGNVNSQLAVGAKTDRSFVVRGNKIGVFKHSGDNQLQYATTINDVKTAKGKTFAPKRVMLHNEDHDLILQNPGETNSLFRMDLEYGKVVDEWKVHDDIPVNIFTPDSKFAQTTAEQTLVGLSGNNLYRIDPRLAGNKLVDEQSRHYASIKKNNTFTAAATTEQGYIAVASANGDIRLFDRLGIQAKTALPPLGDPIVGLDTTADGRYVLATTKTYILLIDTVLKDGKWEGKLGFEKAFAADSKPKPRRLTLTPSHVAQFQHETKAPLSFTPARFNTGEGAEETTIITATGPFVITWSMSKILKGQKDPYKIKRYGDEIKADNFRFGSDKNIVVALPNEVDMVTRRALQRPTRESIMATPRKGKARGSYLSRNEIVNSPY